MRVKNCLDCQCEFDGDNHKVNYGRGLCKTCYSRHSARGTLEQFPRRMWKSDELVAEADRLQSYGMKRKDVADRLGVTWAAIVSARQRLRHRAAKEASVMEYTEHEKLKKIAPLSQSIGEFLEWLGGEGVHLMRWTETVDSEVCDGTFLSDCRGEMCDTCGGVMLVEVKRNAWAPHGVSTTNMLASFFEIDQVRLEQEKRHMLEDLAKRSGAGK